MRSPEILIKKINENQFICRVLFTSQNHKEYMAPYKLELHVKLNGADKIISKTVMGNKIIEPEACTLLDAPYVPIPDIYVYCDNIKFGLMGTILNKDIEIFSNLYDNNGRKIMEKKYSSKQVADIFNSTCFWKRYYGQNFVFHTDMDSNVDYYLNMINNIMDQVSCFTGIPFRQEVHYYITDEIINLYDLTSDFPITQTNCLAFDNRIMVCLYWNEYIHNILIHETVHVLLQQYNKDFGINTPPLFRVCIEGVCQFVANKMTGKDDGRARFLSAISLLNIKSFTDFRNIFNTENDMITQTKVDNLLAYELMPYLYEQWILLCSFETILNTVLDIRQENFRCDSLEKVFELTIKSSGDMVDCQLNQAYQALYHNLLHSMDMQIDEKEYHSAIERFRKSREVLRYCSCDAIDQKINLLKE